MSSRTFLSTLSLLALPLAACVAAHSGSALEVDASIASVTLAQDCPAPEAAWEADCAEGFDCNWCTQSSLQLRITASDAGNEVPFEIVSIRLHDADSGFDTTIAARNPRTFDGEVYNAWDQTIAPGESLDVSYDTTAPDWSGSGARLGWGVTYEVEVVVRIDGVERTLRAEAMREPEIVT